MYVQDAESTYFGNTEVGMDLSDGEILDELTTSRGEVKRRTLSFGEEKHLQERY